MRLKRNFTAGLFVLFAMGGILSGPAAESWTARDVSGIAHSLPADADFKATVLIFLQPDCPISNQYAPVLNRLREEFSPRGVRFLRVYPSEGTTRQRIEKHTADYGYEMPALLDPEQFLVAKTGVSVTPEVVVFDARGNRLYRGRINDRYVAFGKKRPRATRHDLREALSAILNGRTPMPSETRAIGCYIYRGERE